MKERSFWDRGGEETLEYFFILLPFRTIPQANIKHKQFDQAKKKKRYVIPYEGN